MCFMKIILGDKGWGGGVVDDILMRGTATLSRINNWLFMRNQNFFPLARLFLYKIRLTEKDIYTTTQKQWEIIYKGCICEIL